MPCITSSRSPPSSCFLPSSNLSASPPSKPWPAKFPSSAQTPAACPKSSSMVWMDIWWNPATCRKRSEEHTSELQSHHDLVCRLLLEKKKNELINPTICDRLPPEVSNRKKLTLHDAKAIVGLSTIRTLALIVQSFAITM